MGKVTEINQADATEAKQPPEQAEPAKRTRPNDGIALDLDNAEIRAAIVDADERLTSIEAEVAELNADKKAIIAGLENRGLNRHAFNAARRRFKMNTTHAEGFGNTYVIASRAFQLDLPIEPATPEPPTKH